MRVGRLFSLRSTFASAGRATGFKGQRLTSFHS